MVDKNIIAEVIEDIVNPFSVKCGNRPGYKSPQQKLKEFLARKDEFLEEEYFNTQDPNNEDEDDFWESPRGKYQIIQEYYQEKINWTLQDAGVAIRWNTDLFRQINDYLWKKDGWEEGVFEFDVNDDGEVVYNHHKPFKYLVDADPNYDDESEEFEMTIPQIVDHLSEVVNKSKEYDGLAQPTCFYTFRHWEDDVNVGDIGTFKGFVSMSYNPYVAMKEIKDMGWVDESNRRVLRVWCDKGTRGVVMDENLCGVDWQSEFFIDKGHKWICFGDDGEIVDIYIYD